MNYNVYISLQLPLQIITTISTTKYLLLENKLSNLSDVDIINNIVPDIYFNLKIVVFSVYIKKFFRFIHSAKKS